MYRASLAPAAYCLRQGEIVTDLAQARLSLDSVGRDEPVVEIVLHPFAMLMTQDCDLEQDFVARRKGEVNDKRLPGLLFCEVATAEELFGRLGGRRKEWDRLNIDKNKNERYHFLQRVDASCDAAQIGLEELGIDFKRYFTVPADEVYRRIELGQAKRRCILVSPYLEHLSSRFAYFLSRVALPADHLSE
jgi:hypothetical protein